MPAPLDDCGVELNTPAPAPTGCGEELNIDGACEFLLRVNKRNKKKITKPITAKVKIEPIALASAPPIPKEENKPASKAPPIKPPTIPFQGIEGLGGVAGVAAFGAPGLAAVVGAPGVAAGAFCVTLLD